jgi:putative spermidine/putrescine transport system permease protein
MIAISRTMRTALSAVVIMLCAFSILPIVIVVVLSFGSGSYLSFPPEGFSLQWYARLLSDPRWLAALCVSIAVGTISCIVATGVGFLAAYALVRGRFLAKKFVLAAMLLPMIVPHVITAIALYHVSGKLGLIGNIGWIAICHSISTLPIVLMILLSGLQGVDVSLERAAFSLGATRFETVRFVVFPLLLPSLVSSALFAFLGSFDELIISLFLAGVSAETLPVRIWSSLLLQVEPTIAAVSTCLIVVTIAILLLDWQVNKKGRSRTSATAYVR